MTFPTIIWCETPYEVVIENFIINETSVPSWVRVLCIADGLLVCLLAFITLTSWWPRWRLKSPASRLFTQSFIRTQIKENIKAPRHWPLCGEFTGIGEFPAQWASNAEMFLFDDVIMCTQYIPRIIHIVCALLPFDFGSVLLEITYLPIT